QTPAAAAPTPAATSAGPWSRPAVRAAPYAKLVAANDMKKWRSLSSANHGSGAAFVASMTTGGGIGGAASPHAPVGPEQSAISSGAQTNMPAMTSRAGPRPRAAPASAGGVGRPGAASGDRAAPTEEECLARGAVHRRPEERR